MSSLRPSRGSLQGFDDFQHLVDHFFGRGSGLPADAGLNLPATDIHETENGYEISAELPGVKKEAIQVSLHEGVLSIEAESRSEHEEKGKKQIRSERRYGKYVRRFTLNDSVDEASVNAQFQDGVLTVTVQKRKESAPVSRTIPIN